MVRLVSRLNIDSGPPQIIVDDRTQYRSRVRNDHECLAREIPWTDGLERSETVVTWQDHHERLLHQETECQPRHAFFAPKKSGIDFSLRKSVREQGRILARYHHVDVGKFIVQD